LQKIGKGKKLSSQRETARKGFDKKGRFPSCARGGENVGGESGNISKRKQPKTSARERKGPESGGKGRQLFME